jgi:hypothetical protein
LAAARSMICLRCALNIGLTSTMSPSSFAMPEKAPSKSLSSRTSTTRTVTPNLRASDSVSFIVCSILSPERPPDCHMTATSFRDGAISFRIASRRPVRCGVISVRPVTLGAWAPKAAGSAPNVMIRGTTVGRGCLLCGHQSWRRPRDDGSSSCTNKFGNQFRQHLVIPFGELRVDHNIPSFDVT